MGGSTCLRRHGVERGDRSQESCPRAPQRRRPRRSSASRAAALRAGRELPPAAVMAEARALAVAVEAMGDDRHPWVPSPLSPDHDGTEVGPRWLGRAQAAPWRSMGSGQRSTVAAARTGEEAVTSGTPRRRPRDRSGAAARRPSCDPRPAAGWVRRASSIRRKRRASLARVHDPGGGDGVRRAAQPAPRRSVAARCLSHDAISEAVARSRGRTSPRGARPIAARPSGRFRGEPRDGPGGAGGAAGPGGLTGAGRRKSGLGLAALAGTRDSARAPRPTRSAGSTAPTP